MKLLHILKHHTFITIAFFFIALLSTTTYAAKAVSEDENIKAFYQAVEKNNIKLVKKLVAAGVSVNSKIKKQRHLIERAIDNTKYFTEREEVFSFLISKGININYKGAFDYTLLHMLVTDNAVSSVKMLLQNKVDTSAQSVLGSIAFTSSKSKEMIEIFRKHDENIFKMTDKDGGTLLHELSSGAADLKTLEYVFKYIDINVKDKNNYPAFHALISSSRDLEKKSKAIALFAKNGVDINIKGVAGRTPLLTVFRRPKTGLAVVEQLISLGADLNISDKYGRHAIHYSASNSMESLKYLMSKGIDHNMVTDDNKTPLMFAVETKNHDVVNFLLSKYVNLNTKANTGKTALNIALEKDYSKIASSLKTKGALATTAAKIENIAKKLKEQEKIEKDKKRNQVTDLSSAIRLKDLNKVKQYYQEMLSKPKNERIELSKIVSNVIKLGNIDTFKYFISQGFDIKSRVSDINILQYAVLKNNFNVVKYLSTKKLNINEKVKGKKSLFMLSTYSSVKMVKFLFKIGMKVSKKEKNKAVYSAIDNHLPELAQYFIDKGYKFDKKILSDGNVFREIIRYQNIEILKYLLAKGASIETMVPIYGDQATLLHFAVMIKAKKIIPFILNAGGNPNAKNNRKVHVTKHAIENGDLEVIKLLYENGADIDALLDRHENTALLIALNKRMISVARYLVDKKANVNMAEKFNKNTALHIAARYGYLDLITRMVANGADVHILNQERKAAMDTAIEYSQKEVSNYLKIIEAKTK